MAQNSLYVRTSEGETLRLGKELGRGGDGTIYKIENVLLPSVCKIFHRPMTDVQVRKAILQMSMCKNAPALGAIAPIPETLVYATGAPSGAPAGYVMRELTSFSEIHTITNPGDRLKKYPDKDWRFLVRVASNLAAAVHTVHAQGIVVGDMNDRNIAVMQDSTVLFVDSDSWQIVDNGTVYRCEKGDNLFTPPELRGIPLDTVDRTVNHDAFCLAVLLFQLLFLGRHPFSGIFRKGREDKTQNEKIAEGRFAWGKNASRFEMERPRASAPLGIVGQECGELFERAFALTSVHYGRPMAAEWFASLVRLEQSLQECSNASTHRYHISLVECPWCRIEAESGAALFPIHFDSEWTSVEQLVASGQKVAPPQLYPLPARTSIIKHPPQGTVPHPAVLNEAIAQLDARIAALTNTYKPLEAQWQRLQNGEYARLCSDASFRQATDAYTTARDEFLDMQRRIAAASRQVEEMVKQHEVTRFLSTIPLTIGSVSGIGYGLLSTLHRHGIRTAADIQPAAIEGIPGVGEKRQSDLLVWRHVVEMSMPAVRSMPVPRNSAVGAAGIANADIRKLRAALESAVMALTTARESVERARREAYENATDLGIRLFKAEQELWNATAVREQFKSMRAPTRTQPVAPLPTPVAPLPPQSTRTNPQAAVVATQPGRRARNGRRMLLTYASLAIGAVALWYAATLIGGGPSDLSAVSSIQPATATASAQVILPTPTPKPTTSSASPTPSRITYEATATSDQPVYRMPTTLALVNCDLSEGALVTLTTLPRITQNGRAWGSLMTDTGCTGYALLDGFRPAENAAVSTVNTSANLRSGPGMGFCVAGGKVMGDPVIVNGINEAGDWYRLEGNKWIATSLIDNPPDVSILPVVSTPTDDGVCTLPTPTTAPVNDLGANLRQ